MDGYVVQVDQRFSQALLGQAMQRMHAGQGPQGTDQRELHKQTGR